MTEPKMSLHRKLAQIMYEAERIPKNGTAPREMGGYKFVQVGDAADFIRKALAEKVITMMPTGVQVVSQNEHSTAKGGTITTVDLLTEWTLTDGESGESIKIMSYGAGADVGDKYSGKASTSAMKYALLTGFLLSTGEDAEAGALPERTRKDSLGRSHAPGYEPTEPPLSRDDPRMIEAEIARVSGDDGGLVGRAEVGKGQSDFELRQTPEGNALSFRLVSGRGGIKVVAHDPIASALAAYRDETVGQRVTCWGHISDEKFRPKNATKDVTYQVLTLERIRAPWGELPGTTEPASLPAFSDAELEDIASEVDAA